MSNLCQCHVNINNCLYCRIKGLQDGEHTVINGYRIRFDGDSWFGDQYRVYDDGEFLFNTPHADVVLTWVVHT